jgi:hypothetical protein
MLGNENAARLMAIAMPSNLLMTFMAYLVWVTTAENGESSLGENGLVAASVTRRQSARPVTVHR